MDIRQPYQMSTAEILTELSFCMEYGNNPDGAFNLRVDVLWLALLSK